MRCFHPVRVKGDQGYYVDVPCGKCAACDLNRIDEWKVRCGIERKYSFNAFFITLTYSNESKISDSLNKEDYQKFLKRLRRLLDLDRVKSGFDPRESGLNTCRYVVCGEYGTNYQRPHYHMMLFNIPNYSLRGLKDREYLGQLVIKAWKQGFSQIGDLNEGGIDYIVSYILQRRGDSKNLYKDRMAPFMCSSRKPGIGSIYVEKMRHYHRQEQESITNYTMFEGRRRRMPRFYKDKLFTKDERKLHAEINVQAARKKQEETEEHLKKLGDDPDEFAKLKELEANSKVYRKKNGKLKSN